MSQILATSIFSPEPIPLTAPSLPDLDSLCSSLIYAYLTTATKKQPNNPLIPLANLPRADLALRTEAAAVLSHASLKTSDLLTLDDLPSGLSPEGTRWLLVDHNALTGPLQKYSERVVGCIDHHADEGTVPRDSDEPRIIERAGSCMSLVVNYCRQGWDALPRSGEEEEEQDRQLAMVSLGPILADTAGLTAKEKVTLHDQRAVDFLEAKLKGYDRTKYYAEIETVKKDVSNLSLRDIFRKDYKEWTEGNLKLGISSAVQPLQYLLDSKADGNRDTLIDELRTWADERELDIVVVMTAFSKGDRGFARELLVWARGRTEGSAAVQAADFFREQFCEELQLETQGEWGLDMTNGDSEWRKGWKQGNLGASRKQVGPMVREAMKKALGLEDETADG